MPKGDVLISPTHQSIDGRILQKLFILLSDPQKTNSYVLAITTSKKKNWRLDKRGCHGQAGGDGYYVFKKGDDWFSEETTWILFDSIETLTFDDIQNANLIGNLKKAAQLKTNNIQAVINCVKSWPHTNGFIIDLISK